MKKRSTRKLLASAVLSAGMMLTTAGCDGVRNQAPTTPTHTIQDVAPAETASAATAAPTPEPVTTEISAPAAAAPAVPVAEAADPAPADPVDVDSQPPAANDNAAEIETEYPACPITGNSKRPAYDQATYADCVEATDNGDATDA